MKEYQELRVAYGITRKKIAARIGYSAGSISQYENGAKHSDRFLELYEIALKQLIREKIEKTNQ